MTAETFHQKIILRLMPGDFINSENKKKLILINMKRIFWFISIVHWLYKIELCIYYICIDKCPGLLFSKCVVLFIVIVFAVFIGVFLKCFYNYSSSFSTFPIKSSGSIQKSALISRLRTPVNLFTPFYMSSRIRVISVVSNIERIWLRSVTAIISEDKIVDTIIGCA